MKAMDWVFACVGGGALGFVICQCMWQQWIERRERRRYLSMRRGSMVFPEDVRKGRNRHG